MDIGTTYGLDVINNTTASQISDEKLSSKLSTVSSGDSSDEELMDACKEFETYLVEQVLKGMEKTIMKDEDEEESTSYLDYFGDTLYQEYSDILTEDTDLGIAKMLYESMKRE